MTPPWSEGPQGALGAFIRHQRQLANLSLRELARMSNVSNAYLSQVERGLHEPSLRVMSAVATALSLPLEEFLRATGGPVSDSDDVENDPQPAYDLIAAINAEPRLSPSQKAALLAVYRGFLQDDGTEPTSGTLDGG